MKTYTKFHFQRGKTGEVKFAVLKSADPFLKRTDMPLIKIDNFRTLISATQFLREYDAVFTENLYWKMDFTS